MGRGADYFQPQTSIGAAAHGADHIAHGLGAGSSLVHHLASIIHAALPWLSFPSRAVIDALLLTGGSIGTSEQVANRLGLTTRFGLARMLRQDGLPPLHSLSGYITVLRWVWQWEQERTALSRSALREGREPAACYRLVERVTGAPWTSACASGVRWVLSRLLEECERPVGALRVESEMAIA